VEKKDLKRYGAGARGKDRERGAEAKKKTSAKTRAQRGAPTSGYPGNIYSAGRGHLRWRKVHKKSEAGMAERCIAQLDYQTVEGGGVGWDLCLWVSGKTQKHGQIGEPKDRQKKG